MSTIERLETQRLNELEPLQEFNTVLVVFDSCRFDTAEKAKTPNLDKLGILRKASSLATYTPASHLAMWAGHIPSTRTGMNVPFYHEPTKQMWRITTAPDRDANKGCGMLFEGTDVIDGFRKMDFHVQGIGGVSQFSSGSALRTLFHWSDFIYFGPDLNEERMKPRDPNQFPLHHIDEIVSNVKKKEKWFLFINNPETHYPYDCGDGISDTIQQKALPNLGKVLNLRSTKKGLDTAKEHLLPFSNDLHAMQITSMESLDTRLGTLFKELKSISTRPICVVAVGDHGENFGEIFQNTSLFGHMHPTKECTNVPLWIGKL